MPNHNKTGVRKIAHVHLFRLLEEACKDNCIAKSDRTYLGLRLKNEGAKFWSTTLPKFSKAILLSLSRGKIVAPNELSEFRFIGKLPGLFHGLLLRIFSPKGIVRANPDARALKCIRNVCERIYKLAVDFTSEEKYRAKMSYVELQKEVGQFSADSAWVVLLQTNLRKYYPEFVNATIEDILSVGPRFGPGAMCMRGLKPKAWTNSIAVKSGEFYRKRLVPHKVKRHSQNDFPRIPYMFRHYAEHYKAFPGCDEPQSWIKPIGVCEVLFVPKDSRGPRVISKEEPSTIATQMAFFDWAAKALEDKFCGSMNLKDQDKNRELARKASIDGSYATLDLKEASDRVSFKLMRKLFHGTAGGVKFLLNHARAQSAFLAKDPKNSHDRDLTVPLGAVGGMGSGLTFPLLMLLCHLSVCTAIRTFLGNKTVSYEMVAQNVHVYGDDIIVPTEWAEVACRGLVTSGLLVNDNKSFLTGPFRESCGGDYLGGQNVAPCRMKISAEGLPSLDGRVRSLPIQSIEGLYQLNKHAQELDLEGQYFSAQYIYSLLEEVGIPMPYVGAGYPCFGKLARDPGTVRYQPGTLKTKIRRKGIVGPVSQNKSGFVLNRWTVDVVDNRYVQVELVKSTAEITPGLGDVEIDDPWVPQNTFDQLGSALRRKTTQNRVTRIAGLNLAENDLLACFSREVQNTLLMDDVRNIKAEVEKSTADPSTRRHHWWQSLVVSDPSKIVVPRSLTSYRRQITTTELEYLTI